MNSVFSDLEREFRKHDSYSDVVEIILEILQNCSFVLSHCESVPKNVDSVSSLIDNLAVEILNNLTRMTVTGDGKD
ncbi:protein U62 [Suid betaherpesvirus 2]|uniref:Protein U62 n=1 Tax=Suid betaherpesvirus 2 TaxID=1608255 RepID=U3GS45_9BETA|nr:protein U62 [Suid betaherpesvirus 2]AGT99254.1 protein U62 [Suid betaherpesvirus 2]